MDMTTADGKTLELKRIAAELTASMLDNHNADWDDTAVARAFATIYRAIRDAS